MDVELLQNYIDAGLSIIPVHIKADERYNAKSPKLKAWKEYQEHLPSKKEVNNWFSNADDNTGAALICGSVSGNVEIIDIDNHLNDAEQMYEDIIELIRTQYPEMLDNIIIQKTQSGGYHIIYRREDEVPKNHKLAKKKKDGKVYTLIETRGEGGYALIHPSPLYFLIRLTNQKNSIANIRNISEKQRYFLHHICKSFDDTNMHVEKEHKQQSNNRRMDEGLRAGDDYNTRSTIEEIVKPHGWKLLRQTGKAQHWTRPGKDTGLSATYNYIPNTFWVFSTNAHPLESGRKYDHFGLWTALNVGDPDITNNIKEAALQLGKKGFGSLKIQNDSGNAVGVLESKTEYKNGVSQNLNHNLNHSTISPQQNNKMNIAEKNDYVEKWLKSKYCFRYNIVKGYVEFSQTNKNTYIQLTDKYVNQFWRDLVKQNINTSRNYLDNLIDSDFSPEFHPFKEFFKSLPEWDGNDHFAEFIDMVKADKDYVTLWDTYFRRWIVGVVANALEQGLNHNCIVFKGGQGIGKTTIINRLVPPALQQYYATTQITPQDKDSKLLLTDSFLINLDELESSTRNEVGHLKSLMTLDQVTARRPYGRRAEILKRRASFIASVNRTSFLSDLTGSRRFLVVEVKDIDFQKEFDVMQIWAQALDHYKAGMPYWFGKDEIEVINQANKPYEILRPEEELIQKYFEPYQFDDDTTGKDMITLESNKVISLMTATDIFDFLKRRSPAHINPVVIGQVMNNLGFKKKLIKRSGTKNPVRYYPLKKINIDDYDEPSVF